MKRKKITNTSFLLRGKKESPKRDASRHRYQLHFGEVVGLRHPATDEPGASAVLGRKETEEEKGENVGRSKEKMMI